VRLGDHSAHSLGDTVLQPPGLRPSERDSGYKCYLTRLPASDCSNFCRRFSQAVAQAKAAQGKVEVTECVRFPVANVVKAVTKDQRKEIKSQKGHKCGIRGRTWQVCARDAGFPFFEHLFLLGCDLLAGSQADGVGWTSEVARRRGWLWSPCAMVAQAKVVLMRMMMIWRAF
jgi:hypothetical protein